MPSLSLLRVLDLTTDGKQWHELINGRAHQSWHLGLHFLKDTSEIEPLMLFYSPFLMLWNSSSNTECYFSFLSNFKGISAIKLGVLQPKNISAVSFFGLLDNNASCVSNRVNIALFGTLWKENFRRRWEKSARLGQHLTWKWVVNINCCGATKFSRAVGEDLSCASKCILEEKSHCFQINC